MLPLDVSFAQRQFPKTFARVKRFHAFQRERVIYVRGILPRADHYTVFRMSISYCINQKKSAKNCLFRFKSNGMHQK